ncbi:MAG: hypothetical protein WC933_00310 [Candidatus Paceibacterota bacterium]|jgi:hypothetical protein
MTDRHTTRKLLQIILISAIILFIFGYTAYEIQRIIFGPRIEVLSPQNGSLISNSLTEVSGIAKNINSISLNDRKIFIDEQGNFKEEVLLSYGYNVITIKASDKFGRNTEKIIEVIYK